jgi:hypothetical protein
MGLQFGYDFNSRVHATVTLANVVNRCFGGTKTAWQQAYQPNNFICGYGPNGYSYVGNTPGAGYFYGASGHDAANGTAGYPGYMDQSYGTQIGAMPFQAYFQLNVKL